jgi:hypothetical protein
LQNTCYDGIRSNVSTFTHIFQTNDTIVWGSDLTKRYPIEDEQWIDLSRIDKLEKDVKKLKEQLKTAEGKH